MSRQQNGGIKITDTESKAAYISITEIESLSGTKIIVERLLMKYEFLPWEREILFCKMVSQSIGITLYEKV